MQGITPRDDPGYPPRNDEDRRSGEHQHRADPLESPVPVGQGDGRPCRGVDGWLEAGNVPEAEPGSSEEGSANSEEGQSGQVEQTPDTWNSPHGCEPVSGYGEDPNK